MKTTNLENSLHPNDDIAVSIVDNDTIRGMNEQFLSHEGPTDVITFDYREDDDEDGPRTAGEIIVSSDYAAAAAAKFGNTVSAELALYVVHGLLHLSGCDDHEEADRVEMRRREAECLTVLTEQFDLDRIFAFADE
ncbi:MAG: putative rRNA maturation factor [Rhodothermales bacterium]